MSTLADYRDRPHWSYSALNQFFNICSLQFAFQRILKLPAAFTPVSLGFGSAYHRVMEHVALLRMEGRTPTPADASDLFQSAFERQIEDEPDLKFDDGADAESCARLGRDMCACYVEGIDPEEQVVAISEALAVPMTDATGFTLETPLIGEIDCVVAKDGKKSLVDWKTSGSRWPKAKASRDWQPTAMLLGYGVQHGETPDFRFDVVGKNKKPVFEQHITTRGPDDFCRLATLARLAESMIAAEHFAPNEQSFYCAGCPYQTACQAWHRETARAWVPVAA